MMSDGTCVHGEAPGNCLFCQGQDQVADVPRPDPTRFTEDVALMISVLEKHPDWLVAERLIIFLNAELMDCNADRPKRFTRTYIRHLAKGSRGKVISGQKGYKATAAATRGEVESAAGALMKAASGCIDRRSDLLFVFHNGRTKTERERTKANAEQTTNAA